MGVEFKILYWFQSLHNQVLDKIMVFITKLGSENKYDVIPMPAQDVTQDEAKKLAQWILEMK